MKSQQKQNLIYVHIPKTAGTTLRLIIERNYSLSSILSLYDMSVDESIAYCQSIRDNNCRFVVGHVPFGLHVWLSQPAIYITMLRDPVERVISYYYHILRHPEHFAYKAANNMTLADFVLSGAVGTIENGQTKYLASSDGRYPQIDSQDLDEVFELVRMNLEKNSVLIGLVEQFDASLILFRRALGWRIPLYVKVNVGKYRPLKEDINSETLEIIEAYNKLDVKLYQYAENLLAEYMYMESFFHMELSMLRMLNYGFSYSMSVGRILSRIIQRA